ncbi:hypothetical protein DESC_200019 [Desulfosarcina cetonica]|nr:hypothetical protein DESC_200019 [Desulfosarcina cetonica]
MISFRNPDPFGHGTTVAHLCSPTGDKKQDRWPTPSITSATASGTGDQPENKGEGYNERNLQPMQGSTGSTLGDAAGGGAGLGRGGRQHRGRGGHPAGDGRDALLRRPVQQRHPHVRHLDRGPDSGHGLYAGFFNGLHHVTHGAGSQIPQDRRTLIQGGARIWMHLGFICTCPLPAWISFGRAWC